MMIVREIATGALGASSLFPLAGVFLKERDFFPKRYPKDPELFCYIATIFSLIVFVIVRFTFESLPIYIPVLAATSLAAIFLALHIGAHALLRSRYEKLPKWVYAMVLVVLIADFSAGIMLITYSYNSAVNLMDYHVVYGSARDRSGATLDRTKLTLYLKNGEERVTTTVVFGYFAFIIANKDFERISGLRATRVDAANRTTHTVTKLANELPLRDFMILVLDSP